MWDKSYISMVKGIQEGRMNMDRRLIIDGNAVYEIDEKCMLKKQLKEREEKMKENAAERDGEEEEVLTIYKMKRTE
ncbi:MAG: hypothetical protein HFG92_09855 [Dorea sp.]|jgi:hypothetical protein|nr:hypothetical protein [Dorea sp.]